jgi:DNA-binding transcriptional MerR regulator/methylmalonyl-CoA mutase cobalamin-binding subunit
MFSIGEIERETGICRDTLRVWERRYGFPQPQRTPHGERAYSGEQLGRLRLIKQLLDRGMRPGKIVAVGIEELQRLTSNSRVSLPWPCHIEALMKLLDSCQWESLEMRLLEMLEIRGLRSFLTELIAPLNHCVGDAWFAGRIGIVEEHYYTELVKVILTGELSRIPKQKKNLRALLTTLPGEAHGIGLMMAACMISLEGGDVLSLGLQTPLEEIVRCALAANCGVVGLSCSLHMSRRSITPQLVKLRKMLPDNITLWIGGGGAEQIRYLPGNIRLFSSLDKIGPAINV